MGKNIFEKIISEHITKGEMLPGQEIAIRIDQTLTQDSLGAIAYLQFEALKIPKVKTELSVSYVDHLMIQQGPANADVHNYLMTVANKYGIYFSKPGNGICHQVHLERFSKPGCTLIGGDSHTVTCGAAGMVAIGAGGLDVAVAMGGGDFYFKYPRVIKVNLIGRLKDWVAAKDIVLEVLRRITTKGNVGTVLEYSGPGLACLTVPERATIANMGAEAGVTTSIFPSDEMTRTFFRQQGRENDWIPLYADKDAVYDGEIEIDLCELEPLVALPHSPDNVKKVSEVEGLEVSQVLIGSCTNSSFKDLMMVAKILKGRKVHPNVSLGIAPGSRQVLTMLAENGALTDMVSAGARILESGCGFCVGHGQSPHNNGISVRTNNRNYKGRCGTQNSSVFLVSPETAAATAIAGKLTYGAKLGIEYPKVELPDLFVIDDSMIIPPKGDGEIYRSPVIGEPPFNTEMPENLNAKVAIVVKDKINTDDIIPAGPAMEFRANVEKSCEFVFQYIDKEFFNYCKEVKNEGFASIIVAGESYGQGSSREHAAMCPMVMGVRAVIAKSIERIHQSNLINFGIMPLIFDDENDYEDISKGDILSIDNIYKVIFDENITVNNLTKNKTFIVKNSLTKRQSEIILKGGLLNYVTGK
ncbi:MAG: aconitate hydratase [Clostridia bacterium]|nr:aconitate hydratase [Clostridia bacterium]